jgi:uncharacterized membrane protein
MAKSLIYEYLTDDELLRVSNKIKEKELLTSGEICLSIKEKRNLFDRNKDVRLLAEKEFLRLGVNNTKENTGILIFILLADREFYILADQGINSKVTQNMWDEISKNMGSDFSKGNFSAGLINCIESVGQILSKHFPVQPGDINELSNKVIIR